MANKGNIVRKWYVLDAPASPWARPRPWLPTCCAAKRKPEYTPHADCGDLSSSSTLQKAVLTGKSWIRSITALTPAGWAA